MGIPQSRYSMKQAAEISSGGRSIIQNGSSEKLPSSEHKATAPARIIVLCKLQSCVKGGPRLP